MIGRHREISAIMVPAGHARLHVCPRSTPRWAGTPPTPASCSFDDCRVPAGNLLGERGRGYAQFLAILDEGRIAIAALAVGPGAGLRRRVGALRTRARGVRPPDRRVPGDPVQDRGHGGARPHRAAGLLRGSGEAAARRAVQEGGGDREAGTRPRTRPWTTRARRPRSTAGTGS